MDAALVKLLFLIVTSPIWLRVGRAFREELFAMLAADKAQRSGEGWVAHPEDFIEVGSGSRTQRATWERAEDGDVWTKTRLVNRAWDSGRRAPRPADAFGFGGRLTKI